MRDGILVLDKPAGITSFQLVRTVRRTLGLKKAGHTGTLDPIATGVLPVCLGGATKLVQFLMHGPKAYAGTMTLGVTTDTYDAEGRITAKRCMSSGLDIAGIRAVARRFTGSMLQSPPPFSAAKFQGQPLYKLARKGIVVEKDPRPVDVFSLEIEAADLPLVRFTIRCSKGTYVRSIIHDIGLALGCGAHLSALRRVECGPFTAEQAIKVEALEGLVRSGGVADLIIPPWDALSHIPAVVIDRGTAEEITHGRPVSAARIAEFLEQQDTKPGEGIPFLRLLVNPQNLHPGTGGGGENELISVVAWPGRYDEGQDTLRPLKTWVRPPLRTAGACTA